MTLKPEEKRPFGGLDIDERIILKRIYNNMWAFMGLIWLRIEAKCGLFEHCAEHSIYMT
jgi:hypothetical protein